MTLTLTQMTDLQRVRIALSGLNSAVTSVKVERSLNELLWMTVRGGVELPVDTGDATLDDYEWFDAVQNFYRVTTLNPEPGMLLDGTGDYASTPDAAALDITGDIELYAEIIPDDQTPAAEETILAKWQPTGDERSYKLSLLPSGLLRFAWSTDGTDGASDSVDSSEAPSWPSSGRLAVGVTVDVDNGSSDADITFVTAATMDGSFAQLGSVRNPGAAISLNSGAGAATVGANADGSDGLAGTVDAVKIVDGLGGAEAANPDFAAEESGTSSFDDDAGLTWTMQGDAAIVTFETNSITPSLAGEVWLKSIQYPFLNRALPRVLLRDPSIGRRSRSDEFPASGRSVGVATTDLRLGQQFTVSVMVEDSPLQWARDMDLILASGELFFIHTPSGWPGPGGYVVIGESEQLPITGAVDSPQEFTLPCTVIAPPSPLVVGTTLTWGTVERLYGSWEALLAANSTWIDLLDTVGSPEDLVVL